MVEDVFGLLDSKKHVEDGLVCLVCLISFISLLRVLYNVKSTDSGRVGGWSDFLRIRLTQPRLTELGLS